MKRRLKNLVGFTIGGTDGEIGKVKEFYFDDESWTIRYLVVETGSWLFGRKVLLSPQSVTGTDWHEKIFNVNLTTDQIKNSPDIDTDKPVSRQQESELYGYYPWGGYYWGGGIAMGGFPASIDPGIHNELSQASENKTDDNPHLRSTGTVTGYNIKAIDGDVGDVEDFIVNELTWAIDFILVDTGNWFPGKKVVISPGLIKEINWESSSVIIQATEEAVKNSPEYEPDKELSASYEANLQNYYGRYIRK